MRELLRMFDQFALAPSAACRIGACSEKPTRTSKICMAPRYTPNFFFFITLEPRVERYTSL